MILQNATVWLIGASSGIGAALAPELAAHGARLALSARREAELLAVAGTAAQFGPRPIAKPLDVRDLDATRRAYGELLKAWEKVDVLLFNSGVGGEGDITQVSAETLVTIADVNYLGLLRATGVVLPDMIARGSGEIVGMASVAGYAGLPRAAAYSSSKVAMNAYLQSLRIDLRRFGIGVTTINPGFVMTDLTTRNRFAMPFLLTAEDAARRIVQGLLAGDEEIHFPRRLTWPAKAVTALPRPVYESLARRFMTRR